MSVPGRVLAFAGAVVVIAIGAVGIEARFRQQDVQDLRQEITEVRARSEGAVATATQAASAAKQAMDRAEQAKALAQSAKDSADHPATVSAAAPSGGSSPAQQQTSPTADQDVKRGRDLALLICTACHVVGPDQPLPPRLVPPGPDFHSIANRPATTAQALHEFLVVPHGRMPSIPLADYQINPLVSYLISLRDQR